MPDVTVTLGNITFTDLEVPERIPWSTEQQIVTHKHVGGARTLDAMGQDYPPMEWSGWILGPNAVQRAQSLEAMAASGLPQTLTWSGLTYQVIVRGFHPVFERFYQIPYRIVCEVIANNTQPVVSSATPPIDQSIADDSAMADTMVVSVGDSTLSILMATVDALIGGA
jgi:hypothetical protein